MNIGELFIQIGVKGDPEKIKEFEKRVKSASKSIAGFATAIAAAYWALDRLTDSLAKQNRQWMDLTRQSDIALSTFQKWGTIGKIVGVDNAAQQLENLNQKIFNLRLTGEDAKGFQMAGIMPTNAEDVLEQLRTRISGMSNTAATYLLQQMGLDPRMITLLRMGREEWEEYLKVQKKYTLNEEQRKEIDRLNRQLEVARIKMQYLKDKAILAIMPYFAKFTQSIARITEMLAKFIEKSWRVLGILTLWGLKFKNVRVLFSSINSSMGSIIAKIPIFGRMFAQLGTAFSRALLPLTALYLLLDDLAVFFEGGDSLIGRVINWGKEKGGNIFEGFKQIFGGDFFGGAGKIFETLLDSLIDVLEAISTILEGLLNVLTFGLWKKFRESKINSWLFPDVDKVINDVKGFNGAMSPYAKYTTNSHTRNQNTTITQDIDIWTNESVSHIGDNLRYAQKQATQLG